MIVLRLALSLLYLTAVLIAGFLTWARLTAPADPDRVLAIWPHHAQSLTQQASELYSDAQVRPEALAEFSGRLLTVMPLSEMPLVLSGTSLAAEDRGEAANRLFEAARMRQPRNVPALTRIAAKQIEDEHFAEALESLEILRRLNPDAEAVYVETAASIAGTPTGGEAMKAALKAGSHLAAKALIRLNRSSDDFALLLDLNAHDPSSAGIVVERLVTDRGVEAAFIAWLSLIPATEATNLQWPYDGAFVGMIAPPPFSWTIAREAELQSTGGLYISFSGSTSERPVFARQTMLVGPGRYTLQADMEGETSEEGAHFEWTVHCTGSGIQIALLTVKGLTTTIQSFTTLLEVPEGCSSQEIALLGKPGVFPVRARTIVRRVKIMAEEASP